MSKRPVTWYVLTDGSRSRILTRRMEGPGYDVVDDSTSTAARVPTREIISDKPGRVHESANSAHHAVEPRHDPHRERKAEFARELADRLNQAASAGEFDALVLYAAPRTLATLRSTLDDTVHRKIKAEIPKDLTKVPLGELPQHFAELTKSAD
jgi:protein required for attachment to host cells